MQRAFRLLTITLLAGGWTLSAAALHVVRAPGHVVVVPKDRLGFHDTYVDARHWTLTDVSAHPAVSARLVQIGRSNLLADATDPKLGDPQVQILAAIAHPQVAPPATQPAMVQRVKDGVNHAVASVKSVLD